MYSTALGQSFFSGACNLQVFLLAPNFVFLCTMQKFSAVSAVMRVMDRLHSDITASFTDLTLYVLYDVESAICELYWLL